MTKLINNMVEYGDLHRSKYLRESKSEDHHGPLSTFKYSKAAFYDQAWTKYPLLMQARGHTFCGKTGTILTRPFDKVLNYSENGAGVDIPDNHELLGIDKINGFMACATKHKDRIILQTAGTVVDPMSIQHNEFCTMFMDKFSFIRDRFTALASDGVTYLFECTHENDPHIVPEKPGLHLLAMRNVDNGIYALQDFVQRHALKLGVFTIPRFLATKKQILEMTKVDKGEGLMVLDPQTNAYVFKLKTPHYLARKFLARVKKASYKEEDPRHDEEVRAIIRTIQANGNLDTFLALTDTERLDFITKHHDKLAFA